MTGLRTMSGLYSSQKMADIWNEWQNSKSESSRESLIVAYMPLVDYVADRVAINMPSSVQKDDLRSLGYIGLMEALDRFDTYRGLKFETFAMWRIKGAILDGLRKADWVPRSVRKKAKDIEEAFQMLQSQQKEPVTDEQIAGHLNMSLAEYSQLVMDIQSANFVSIDETAGEEGSLLSELIPDKKMLNPEQSLDLDEIKNTLIKALGKLPEKERSVVAFYYYEELTLTEIAKIMSVSTSRISQLHSKALMRLRSYLAKQKYDLL